VFIDGKHRIDRSACSFRAECIKNCAAAALEIVGRDIDVEEVLADVMQEQRYYKQGEGGVTVSGGEPSMQPEFLRALLRAFKQENIHTALETSGFCDYRVYEQILPYVDLFLYDCKETNPKLHKQYTGVENKLILENLRKLYAAGAKILLRCPVIPGLNDREDHFKALANLSKKMPDLAGLEILPYHKLAASKIEYMGLEAQREFEQPPGEKTDLWAEILRSYS
jgi:pyruvate formate lyase activating enzyme